MNLSSIDLNLLVVLGALLETASVKDAATKVGLSASATSHALNRLRDLLSDQLLVRAGQTMVLSPRAERLRPHIARLLHEMSEVLQEDQALDPATLTRTFRMSAVDYVDRVLLEPLALRMSSLAPGVNVYTKPPGDDEKRLRAGELDLCLGVFPQLPPDLDKTLLFVDRMVCVMREGHPLADRRLTLSRYLSVPHILTAPHGGERAIVDFALEKLGKTRRVARTTTTFEAALRRLSGTDYLVTIPRQPALRLAKELGLTLRPTPLEIGGMEVSMVWHRRQTDDHAHSWLREQLALVAKERSSD